MKRLKNIQVILGFMAGMLSIQCYAADKAAELDWYQYMLLSTPVSGVVDQVHVQPGQQVKQKQKLVSLDGRMFRAQVKQAEAVLVRANETYAEAKRELERAEELFDRTAISVHDRELVKIEFTKADASLRQAQAELTQARLELEYSEIRAPIDGIIVQVQAHKGQTVISRLQAQPLVALASTSRMLARAMLSAAEMDSLRQGMPVDVRIGGQTLAGTIHHLGLLPLSTEQAPLYLLEVAFDPAGEIYRKGQRASVILP